MGKQINLSIQKSNGLTLDLKGGAGGGTTNYNALTNKPIINDVTVVGNKTGEDYSLQNLLIAGEGITLEDNLDHTTTISVSGGTGSGALTADLIVSNPLGKYTMNEVIAKDTSFETIFRGLLSKTYYPTLTDPSVSLSYGASTLVKVGNMIPALTATVNFNRGSINPQYTAESPYRSGVATSYTVNLTGASITYSDTKETNQFSIPTFTRNSKGNVVLNASANYEAGIQPKDSDGGDYKSPLPAGNKSTSKTIEFILPFYYGASDTTDVTSLEGLKEDLSKKGQKVYKITTANQHMTIVYDSSYGNLTSILDANNFELIQGWIKTTKVIDGQSYNVYVADIKTIDTDAQFTFKF